jgi:hypothetical protein
LLAATDLELGEPARPDEAGRGEYSVVDPASKP